MNTARQQAYFLTLDIADRLRTKIFYYPLTESKIAGTKYSRNKLTNQGVGIKGLDWANVSSTWIVDLSNTAALFVMKNIIPNMKKYNLLWHWPPATKKSEKLAIKELTDKKLIFRTETIGIYLINPIKIWKGDSITCIEATKELLRIHRKPSLDIIHDLRPGDMYDIEVCGDVVLKLLGNGDLDV